ncbi:glycosyl transferase [Bacillus sp. AFS002410]|uniref:glycosyltransferase n=1 Tax=Bacillus sp. AFS002410 TaxID=2033481 RepID=UPI000BEFA6B9|nr:glycosyltransferase [Bacillus sp. AFS002410]PEJ58452.1 glycosyl transferase [Bacillus sp. AFS002410]
MKKNILFIINNLNCGGAEKALISLLETLDYRQYNVDLFLFKHEGLFLNKLPEEVNLLKEPLEYKYFDMSIKAAIKSCLKKGRFDIAISRAYAGYIFKTEKNKSIQEQKVWKCLSRSIQRINKEYDIAIGYLENSPVYFCIEKVSAKKKLGFIHNDYEKLGMDSKIDNNYFSKLDNIVTVSNECATVLKTIFPKYQQKVEVMHNILSPSTINKLSLESIKDNDRHYSGIKLVSIGRLHEQKGFDMAVDACEKLVEYGLEFKWYVIGEGEERTHLEELIEKKNLKERFILLGLKDNPYPFIRSSDIYIQPSRFEGKSIAIDEAKILNKPIIVTDFSTVKDQIQNNVNGIIVKMDPNSIANGIKRLIKDDQLKKKLISNLSNEQLGTESEIEKLYFMFNEK